MTPKQEARARQLAEFSGLSQPYDGAMIAEGGDLLGALIAEVDRLREEGGLDVSEDSVKWGECAAEGCAEDATARAPDSDIYYCAECWEEMVVPILRRNIGQAESDLIDNPKHYGGKDNPYEVHKVQVAWHGIEKMAVYFQLTAEVYLARAGKKEDHVSDLRKAAWYANAAADAIEHEKYRP